MSREIYHGTPMTPRAALLAVLPGRAGCVSYFRPDDAEAVEAVCPRIMFRQRRFQFLARGREERRGMGSGSGLDPLLSMAGAAPESRTLGCNPRHARRTFPAQRWAFERLAVRQNVGCSLVAYGRPSRPPCSPLRPIRQGGPRMDRRPEARARGLPALPRQDGRCGQVAGQPLAALAHDARGGRGVRLSVRERRQHIAGAERVAL